MRIVQHALRSGQRSSARLCPLRSGQGGRGPPQQPRQQRAHLLQRVLRQAARGGSLQLARSSAAHAGAAAGQELGRGRRRVGVMQQALQGVALAQHLE